VIATFNEIRCLALFSHCFRLGLTNTWRCDTGCIWTCQLLLCAEALCTICWFGKRGQHHLWV